MFIELIRCTAEVLTLFFNVFIFQCWVRKRYNHLSPVSIESQGVKESCSESQGVAIIMIWRSKFPYDRKGSQRIPNNFAFFKFQIKLSFYRKELQKL